MRNYSERKEIKVVGIDLAKDTFHLHGADAYGNAVMRKKLSRSKLTALMANLSPCLVGMETCGGSHDWARRLMAMGHDVRLMTIPGVGPITATALAAAVADAKEFKNGREMSAWLGLVPRQHSTGGKPKLLGISKRGDTYLRKLLIHGARAALRFADRKQDRRSRWVMEVESRRGRNIAAVALANKTVRTSWVL